ncbi:hypothetical protein ACEPAG_3686 [Sanghuangporus baumii]
MLILEDRKDVNGKTTESFAADGPPPPPYNLSSEPADNKNPLSGVSSLSQSRVPFYPRPINIPTSNFVKIKRKNTSVKGTFVIDAGLRVPEGILFGAAQESEMTEGAVPEGETGRNDEARKNLYLESANASAAADVWLVDDEESTGDRDPEMVGKRAELELKSHNGSVNLRLETATTRSYALTATSHNGSVSVAIPADFVGPVTLTAKNWCVSLSGAVQARLITFSEENGTRNCFIGDFKRAGYTGRQAWTGSSIDMGSHNGRVTLSYIGEEKTNPGFWRRIFGG